MAMPINEYHKLGDDLISADPGLLEEAKDAWIIADRLVEHIGNDPRNDVTGGVLKQAGFRSHVFSLVVAYKMDRSNKELAMSIDKSNKEMDKSNKELTDQMLKYTKRISWLTAIVTIATVVSLGIAVVSILK